MLQGDLIMLTVLLLVLIIPVIIITTFFLLLFLKRRKAVKAFQREITAHLEQCGQELRNNETLH